MCGGFRVKDDLIQIRISPVGSRKKYLGLEAFVAELQAIHGALVRLDRLMSGGRPTTRYNVVDLSMNSPACMALAPMAVDKKVDKREAVVGGFFDGLHSIRQGETPAEFDRPMLEKVREIASGVSKRRVKTELEFRAKKVEINRVFERRITNILGQTEVNFGSVDGRLEALNIHSENNVFVIFPAAGARKVTCYFQPDMKETVLGAIDKFVTVSGYLEYYWKDRHPFRVRVRNIDVHEFSGPWPKLDELRGVARDILPDMDSLDFVEQVRDGWR